ncbi:MAG: hypothetical protein L6R38_005359 [Xanthoria sp. 2 TBL-2021]|nr:MAG: hypothetical protein L6R38_005359 [Xanthoria sp. 2 TBL-2021]
MAVLGEGGIMNGWGIYDIDERGSNGSVQYVDVLVVRMNTETKRDEMQVKSEATSEWIPTPGTKIVEINGDGTQVNSEATSEWTPTTGTSLVDGQ